MKNVYSIVVYDATHLMITYNVYSSSLWGYVTSLEWLTYKA